MFRAVGQPAGGRLVGDAVGLQLMAHGSEFTVAQEDIDVIGRQMSRGRRSLVQLHDVFVHPRKLAQALPRRLALQIAVGPLHQLRQRDGRPDHDRVVGGQQRVDPLAGGACVGGQRTDLGPAALHDRLQGRDRDGRSDGHDRYIRHVLRRGSPADPEILADGGCQRGIQWRCRHLSQRRGHQQADVAEVRAVVGRVGGRLPVPLGGGHVPALDGVGIGRKQAFGVARIGGHQALQQQAAVAAGVVRRAGVQQCPVHQRIVAGGRGVGGLEPCPRLGVRVIVTPRPQPAGDQQVTRRAARGDGAQTRFDVGAPCVVPGPAGSGQLRIGFDPARHLRGRTVLRQRERWSQHRRHQHQPHAHLHCHAHCPLLSGTATTFARPAHRAPAPAYAARRPTTHAHIGSVASDSRMP